MSRITKNNRRINPRYFLNENEEWEAKHGANMEPRITTGMGSVPGLKDGARGNSIIVDRGRQRSDGAYQIHVLPKAVGLYDSFYSAVMSGMSGERYYMTDEEIEAGTMPDSVRPGQFSKSDQSEPGYGYPVDGEARYVMRENKTTKTLMEGFKSFLNEMNNPKHALEAAIYYTLRDYNASEQNPTPLSAIFDSSSGAILKYLKEQGLDGGAIGRAMSGAGKYTRGEMEIAVPGGDGGEYVKLKLATVPVGPSAGEQGMYMVSM